MVKMVVSEFDVSENIETYLTEDEKQWIQEGRQHYKDHPEDFVPFESNSHGGT